VASGAKLQGVRGSARLAALQITGLSAGHLSLVLDSAASVCGLSRARPIKIRYRQAFLLSYTCRGGLRDASQCFPPLVTQHMNQSDGFYLP
jgi:hypothetical protein